MTNEEEIIKRVKYICDNWYDENLEIDVRWLQGVLDLYNKQKEDKKKLMNYIAIRENKTHEDICKEFEV